MRFVRIKCRFRKTNNFNNARNFFYVIRKTYWHCNGKFCGIQGIVLPTLADEKVHYIKGEITISNNVLKLWQWAYSLVHQFLTELLVCIENEWNFYVWINDVNMKLFGYFALFLERWTFTFYEYSIFTSLLTRCEYSNFEIEQCIYSRSWFIHLHVWFPPACKGQQSLNAWTRGKPTSVQNLSPLCILKSKYWKLEKVESNVWVA